MKKHIPNIVGKYTLFINDYIQKEAGDIVEQFKPQDTASVITIAGRTVICRDRGFQTYMVDLPHPKYPHLDDRVAALEDVVSKHHKYATYLKQYLARTFSNTENYTHFLTKVPAPLHQYFHKVVPIFEPVTPEDTEIDHMVYFYEGFNILKV